MLTRTLIVAAMLAAMTAAGAAQAGGDAAHGKELAIDCADCHGENGMGDEDIPQIAGMDPAEMVADLKGYKSGEREDPYDDMGPYVEDLSEQDMHDLAAYYATLGAN